MVDIDAAETAGRAPPPAAPPAIRVSSTSDPFLAMAERLAIVELANAYVYCLQAPFAPRSRALLELSAGTEKRPRLQRSPALW